jgi:dihydrofolate reductase
MTTKVRANMMMSLDGYVAAPNQSVENPFGEGGMRLTEWVFPLKVFREMHGDSGGEENASGPVVKSWMENVGATVMGRNMFGGGPGPWGDGEWTGWWGEDPPYHHPVFVLTHHAREPLEMQGGTTFHFVTEGPEAALARAREAAGDRDVAVGGGGATVRHYLAAHAIDELLISLVPVILGGGERIFADLGADPPAFEPVEVVDAPGVTHIRYRVS